MKLSHVSGRRDASHLLNKGTLATSREVAELTNSQHYSRPRWLTAIASTTAALWLPFDYVGWGKRCLQGYSQLSPMTSRLWIPWKKDSPCFTTENNILCHCQRIGFITGMLCFGYHVMTYEILPHHSDHCETYPTTPCTDASGSKGNDEEDGRWRWGQMNILYSTSLLFLNAAKSSGPDPGDWCKL